MGNAQQEVVLVFRCLLDLPEDLDRVVKDLGDIEGVTSSWGWAGIDDAAQAVLAVVDPS